MEKQEIDQGQSVITTQCYQFKRAKEKNDTILIISILIPISTGVLSAFFSGDMSVYSRLCKPAFSPPAILFPLVWIILYALMGLSSYMVDVAPGGGVLFAEVGPAL